MKGLTTAATTPGVATDRCRRWGNVLYWLLLAVGCAVFMLMNFYTTVKEDDLFHSMIGGGSGRPINSLLDVLRSWVEYYRYDARTANLISFTFNGILGKTAFNICNTLVFGLMAHLLSRLATGRNSAMALVMLFTYMVTAMPVPGETLLWATGSFNYMWAFTAALLFIAYLLWHRDARIGWPKALVVLLLSLLAGGINATRGMADSRWFTTSVEVVVETNPDIIIFNDYGTETIEEKMAFINDNPALSEVPAVKNQNYIVIPLVQVMQDVRAANACETFAKAFWPDRFE